MTTKTASTMIVDLLKAFVLLALGTLAIIYLAWWISPILGSITAMFCIFVWLFGVAPQFAGRMIAALIIYFRARRRVG